jgi:DNA-binding IclR family transcriptional regulator
MFQVWRNVILARTLGIAAELGIADLVEDTPKSAEELAATTGAHADALYRVLRMLASHGVFAEDDQGRFHITPLAAVLQTEHDDSVRAVLRLAWQDVAWDTYRQLPHAVMTGEAAFDHVFGMSQFEYMAKATVH